MGCACGKGPATVKKTYVVTAPDGSKKSYASEVEATSAARRTGGTWKLKT